MFAVVQNGEVKQVIQPDVAFTVGDKQYSARFLRNSTIEEKNAAGVYEIVYGEQRDQRFYWVTGPTYSFNGSVVRAEFMSTAKELEDRLETKEDGSPLYVQTYNPATKQMEDTTEQVVTKGLKSQWIAQTKAAANSQLAQTDWMVIRKAERNVDIPADVAAARAKIISDCAAKEAAIAACTTVEQLMAAV
jgi:hypothetical protein